MVAADNKSELAVLQAHLKKKFDITVTEEVVEYLGIRIERLADGNVLLTQPKLLGQLEEEYEDQLATFRRTNAPQVKEDFQSKDLTPMDKSAYLHLVGALLYLTKSRPDIQTAVSFGATHSSAPTRGHFNELLRCLAYLVNTKAKGLKLRTGNPGQALTLTCYTDASYLTHADSKSHSGYCMSFGSIGTFYSKSGKQTLVATSSTHSEMRGLYTLVIDIVYLVHLCDELHRPLSLPCIALVDNQPVIDLVSQPSGQTRVKRCKHFLMLVDWIREQVIAGYIELSKVATEHNVADILTKIITGGEFKTKAELLLG
jgi:hypothetical protein